MIHQILNWLFIAVLSFCALFHLLAGGLLTYLGGSVFYLLTGLILALFVWWSIRGNTKATTLYGVLLVITLVWGIYESDSQFLALLPRVAFWMGLGLWLLTPYWQGRFTHSSAQSRAIDQRWVTIPLLINAVTLIVFASFGYTQNTEGTVRVQSEQIDPSMELDWRQYGNDDGGSRFSPATQINKETVANLNEAWRFRTGVEDDFKMTPLAVNNMVYLCGAQNILIAIDDATGEEQWRFDPMAVPPASHQYARTCRGLSYYESPGEQSCSKRIVAATIDARLLTVDALTGELCSDFGDSGYVDLRKGMSEHAPDEYYVTSPPTVAGDLLVVGGLVLDSQDLGLPSGVVRAYHAQTGEFVWAWDLGNPGVFTEPAEGEVYTPGTPNVWTIMSYDPELNLVYAPTGNASPDYYGGVRRSFDDEWSSAIVALDAATGAPQWKFQTVHHDIWDYDLPAQPVLVDVERDGQMVPSIAVPTKRGDVFLLDRRDGTPVAQVEEREVPQSPAAGEYLASTQPFSALPNFHPFLEERDMWGLTPLDQLLCRVEYKMLRYEGLFTPPMPIDPDNPLTPPVGSIQFPANFGGFNWGSVSVDADNGLLVAAPMLLANRIFLANPRQVAEAGPQAALLLGQHHPAVRRDEDAEVVDPGQPDLENPYDYRQIKFYGVTLPFMSRFWFPLLGKTQVPCFEPPWSRLATIDLNTGELMWSRPVGSMKNSGPFGWQTGLPFQVGTPIRAGTLTTRGGVTFLSSTMDSTVRAFDIRTGKVLWHDDLPGSGQSTPMTYVSKQNGKQYLIVTVPNPSWRYPRDPSTGTYTDSRIKRDGMGGHVIAYTINE
ncbi:MAG: PQQ-binding-like beta-propeller repeat protein [Pseudomonadota bacterium]